MHFIRRKTGLSRQFKQEESMPKMQFNFIAQTTLHDHWTDRVERPSKQKDQVNILL